MLVHVLGTSWHVLAPKLSFSFSLFQLASCLLAGCRRFHGAKLTEDFLFLLVVPEFVGSCILGNLGKWTEWTFVQAVYPCCIIIPHHSLLCNEIQWDWTLQSFPAEALLSTTWNLLLTFAWATMSEALFRSQRDGPCTAKWSTLFLRTRRVCIGFQSYIRCACNATCPCKASHSKLRTVCRKTCVWHC